MARGEVDLNGAVILYADDVAKALSWPTIKAKRWLRRNKIGRKEPGAYGRWYTTRTLLRREFPEDSDYVIAGSE